MPLFDAYIFVDWSARNFSHPLLETENAVWVGKLIPGDNLQEENYHRTRFDGFANITSCLLDQVKKRRRILVGFDFPYGYPTGFASALDLQTGTESWRSVWAKLTEKVVDSNNNQNNRFVAAGELNTILGNGNPGPFWGHPVGYNINNLQATSPGFPFNARGNVQLKRLRIVESRLTRNGIQETWQLFGRGSVGSQALVGIPYVYKLLRHVGLDTISRVWPFETQFTTTPSCNRGPFILHAEIWPGLVNQRTQELTANGWIRDRAQVRIMCQWAAECDNEGTLGQFFERPNGLDQQQVQSCIEEEGWILGASE